MVNDFGRTQLGIRMKELEALGSSTDRFLPLLPLVARVDGKAFHSFTRGLKRPYDERLSNLMVEMTKFIVAQTGARIGYTQSDEASFVWSSDTYKSQIFHGGRVSKMISITASMATAFFNKNLEKFLPEKAHLAPLFDCRVYQLPVKWEVANYLIWREQDATRNSIQMAAQSVYSHKQLDRKNAGELQEMLFAKGINWNDYPRFFKRGTYVQAKKIKRRFSATEIERLPARHEARTNPNLEVERRTIIPIEMPIFTKVTNKLDVIFGGADPICELIKFPQRKAPCGTTSNKGEDL